LPYLEGFLNLSAYLHPAKDGVKGQKMTSLTMTGRAVWRAPEGRAALLAFGTAFVALALGVLARQAHWLPELGSPAAVIPAQEFADTVAFPESPNSYAPGLADVAGFEAQIAYWPPPAAPLAQTETVSPALEETSDESTRPEKPLDVASLPPSPEIPSFAPMKPLGSDLARYFSAYLAALEAVALQRLNVPADVSKAYGKLAAFDAKLLAEAFVAFSATQAAEAPSFAQSLESGGKNGLTAAAITPYTVSDMSGASEAMARVVAATDALTQLLRTQATRFLDLSRLMQSRSFSAAERGNRARPVRPRSLKDMIGQPGKIPAPGSAPAQSIAKALNLPLGKRILADAALVKLAAGEASMGSSAQSEGKEMARCLHWARLNLDQCLAAAHIPAEEAWCTGTHALADMANCWAVLAP
jgi:hypothetical protein